MANIMDMSLYKIAAATTEPAFADVQKKLDQSFGLFMDVTMPMKQANIESRALRQGMQQTVSAAGSALGTWATGGFTGLAGMFATPAAAPPQSQQVLGTSVGRSPVQQAPQYGGAMASDPAMAPWFSGGPMATQTGGW